MSAYFVVVAAFERGEIAQQEFLDFRLSSLHFAALLIAAEVKLHPFARREMKNINSFNNVKEAIEYEIKRQTEVLESGGKVIQETRRYDDEDKKTYSMRQKVDAIDYKYFVEPNIPPIKVTSEWLEEIRN